MNKHAERIQNEARRLFASWRYDGRPIVYDPGKMDKLLSKTEGELRSLYKADGYDGLAPESFIPVPDVQRQVKLLWHTLGLHTGRSTPYRNYFVASPGHTDMETLKEMGAIGLMAHTPKICEENNVVFHVTEKGLKLALARFKEKRARRGFPCNFE